MVHAYLHLASTQDIETVNSCFLPDDDVEITPVFPDSFILASMAISPSRLRYRLECSLHCGYVIADVKQIYILNNAENEQPHQ